MQGLKPQAVRMAATRPYTQVQLDLKLAELQASNRIWIVNNWIINVDGTFVPQVERSMATATPSIPDFPTVQDMRVDDENGHAIIDLIMAAPVGIALPSQRNCSRIHCGRIADNFAFANLVLHPCGVRIAAFTLEYVFRGVNDSIACRPCSVVICPSCATLTRPRTVQAEAPFHVYDSAVLAENRTLRVKFDELVAANRVLCVREHPQHTPSRTLIINVDGVYVPQIRNALASSSAVFVAIHDLPSVEAVIDKGYETTIAAMIMAAPSYPASTLRCRHGIIQGRNVQVMIDNGDGVLCPSATMVSLKELLFARERAPQLPAVPAPAVPAPVVVLGVPTIPAALDAALPLPAAPTVLASASVDQAVPLGAQARVPFLESMLNQVQSENGFDDVLRLVSDISARVALFRSGRI